MTNQPSSSEKLLPGILTLGMGLMVLWLHYNGGSLTVLDPEPLSSSDYLKRLKTHGIPQANKPEYPRGILEVRFPASEITEEVTLTTLPENQEVIIRGYFSESAQSSSAHLRWLSLELEGSPSDLLLEPEVLTSLSSSGVLPIRLPDSSTPRWERLVESLSDAADTCAAVELLSTNGATLFTSGGTDCDGEDSSRLSVWGR